jgi:hypothetical protein
MTAWLRQRLRMAKSPTSSVDIHGLQHRLEELRRAYDIFFQGLERVVPEVQRAAFTKELARHRAGQNLSSAERFRLQQLQQRLTSYARLWDRSLRQMESGTFRRKTSRAKAAAAPPRNDPDQATYEAFERGCIEAGTEPPERQKFLRQLASKRRALEAKHGVAVRFEVAQKDGQPSLKVMRHDRDG